MYMQALTYMCTLLSVLRKAVSNAYSFSCATATEQGAHLGTLAQSCQVEEVRGGANRVNADSAQLFGSPTHGETYTCIYSVRSWTMPRSATCTSANTYTVNHAAHSSHLPI